MHQKTFLLPVAMLYGFVLYVEKGGMFTGWRASTVHSTSVLIVAQN